MITVLFIIQLSDLIQQGSGPERASKAVQGPGGTAGSGSGQGEGEKELALSLYVYMSFVFCISIHFFCILKVMEEELAALAELRMKEESATELSVGRLIFLTIFDLTSPNGWAVF